MLSNADQIKIQLMQKEVKSVDIALLCKVTPSAVSQTINNKGCKSKAIRTAIANTIGKKVEELWPDKNQDIDIAV